jgi:hypothetical protein
MKTNRTLILNILLIVILFMSCKKEDNNPTPTPTPNPTTIAIGQSYQGGKIAYILQAGDYGYDATMQHGLIAAPSDQGASSQWGCEGTEISGADGTAIGTGAQNTLDIMNGCLTPGAGAQGIAARLCGDLVLGGYSDWYLPSRDELWKLYINKVAIGGFASSYTSNYYWSSTEGNNYSAWELAFLDGYQGFSSKFNYGRVRAVRSF